MKQPPLRWFLEDRNRTFKILDVVLWLNPPGICARPDNLALADDSPTRLTGLINRFCELRPGVRVLRVPLHETTNYKQWEQALGKAVGGQAALAENYLIHECRQEGIQLVVLEGFHPSKASKAKYHQQQLLNALSSLLDQLRIPVVCTMSPADREVCSQHEGVSCHFGLRRRWNHLGALERLYYPLYKSTQNPG